MALQYSPKIITDSLVMCLDASNNKSYPTDLPVKNGLVMWMDAADDTTFSYSSGTTVSQWRDKSGFNYHMVPVSAGPTRNAFLNSRKVIACTTSQQIWNSSINLSTSVYTIFGVTRLTGTTNSRVLTTQYVPSAGGNWLLGHWGGYVNQYYAEGWVAGPYGTAANTAWNIFMGDWSGSSTDLANLYTNGTAIATNSNGASAGPIGLGINVNSETSTCEAAEIVVFNRLLSATERKQVNTYLGQKWGISNTDRSIVDLSNNNIASFGGAAGSQTVANMPTFDFYNKGALRFDGTDDYVVSTVPSIAASSTVGMWIKSSNYGDKIPFSIASATYGSGPNIFFTGNFINWNTGDGGNNPFTNSSYPDNNWHYIVVTNDAATNAKLYIDGVLIGTAAYRNTLSTTSNNLWLGRFSGNNDYTINGNIAGTQIYNKALSAAEVLQNYEAQKSKFANTIVQQGLVLNLDAGNPYSYAGAGTVWYDVSGNNNYFQLTNSPAFISTEPKTFNLSGASQHFLYYASIGAPTGNTGLALPSSNSWTCAFWFRTSTTNSNRNSLLSHMGSGPVYSLMGVSNSVLIYYHYDGNNGGWLTKSATTNVADNNWRNAVFVNTNNTMTIYLNGVLEKSSFSSTATNANNYVNGLGGSWESGFFTGSISTFVYYNTNLSAAQVLQNYNATKGKFGL